MRITPEISSLSLVLVGDFNPKIFVPDWFVAQELLARESVDEQSIEIVHSEVSKFTADWCVVEVQKNRFTAMTESAPLIRISDLTVKLFKDCLPHTPITQFGINRQVHFSLQSEEKYDEIGKKLAPRNAWGEWSSKLEGEGGARGGLTFIEMMQKTVEGEGREKDYIKARVQPSQKARFGLDVHVNDHHRIDNSNRFESNGYGTASYIHERIDDSISNSEWIIDQVMALGV